jgi:tubulin delta
VGTELFSTLAREADASSASTRDEIHEAFFRTPQARRRGSGSGASENEAPENAASAAPVARAVLIDMEPKVVQASLRRAKRSGRWRYDSARTLAFQSGSGNNWARGYNTYGPQTRETALELVRRETEACDHFGGFLLLQSMAGGTGAGLGAYVAEALRDDYAHAALLNHCVWPHESGEVIVQSYNTLLTASALLDVSDGVVVAQNDQLRLTCVKQLGIERPTFDDMNLVAAKQIAGVLLPSCRRDARANGGVLVGAEAPRNGPGVGRRAHLLHDLTRDVCQHPSARLLSLRQTPVMPDTSVDFTTFTWPALLKRTRQMLLSGATLEEGLDWGLDPNAPGVGHKRHTKCLAASLFLRGAGADAADASVLSDPALFPSWAPSPCAVQWSPGRFDGKEMSCTLLSNCQTPCPPVGRMLARAYQMRAAGAYAHQYAEHGVGDAEFEQAFGRVEDVLATYRAL